MKVCYLILFILFQHLAFAPCIVAEEKPLFYGWFFNEETATSITNLTQDILHFLNDTVPEFRQQLLDWADEAGVGTREFYKKPTDPNSGDFDPFYHITAKYCGDTPCPEYEEKVGRIIEQTFPTSMVGYVFSARTYGIRVNLTQAQAPYFDMEETSASSHSVPRPYYGWKDVQDLPGIQMVDQNQENLQPSQSRAHITLGCAPNVSAVTTGLDLIDVLRFEMSKNYTRKRLVTGNYQGNLVQWGDPCEYLVFYPSQGFLSNTTFEVYYSSASVFFLVNWPLCVFVMLFFCVWY